MTTINEARETVYARVALLWTDTVFTFEGDRFVKPKDAAWLEVAVRQITGGQETIGGPGKRLFTRKAKIFSSIQSPIGSGLKGNDLLSTTFLNLFEAQRVGDLEFFDGEILEVGTEGKRASGARFQASGAAEQKYTIEIEFNYHERK